MVNHNIFLTKLRWQTVNKDFNEMHEFSTDCFRYVFEKPLGYEEQNDFLTFVGNSDNLNHLTPIDFCNYFIEKNIGFKLKYKYVSKLGIKQNFQEYKIVNKLTKILREREEKIMKRKQKY